jgi:hypothetical protein
LPLQSLKGGQMLDLDQDYLAKAAEARATAGLQVLENVRQKHLTAAATWAALAHSARKMAELRARRVIERSPAAPAAFR